MMNECSPEVSVCVTAPPRSVVLDLLPQTGIEAGEIIGLVVLLLVVGLLALVAARKMR